MNKIYDQRIYSYLTLRQTVGWIGIGLPVVLLIYTFFFPELDEIQPSLSLYYHTYAGDIFVGALCAVGLFMLFYAGYSRCDNWVGNIAGICAILTAWCYTEPLGATHVEWYNKAHFIFAGLLFTCFSFFSLFLFTVRVNNKVYKAESEDIYIKGAELDTWRNKMRRSFYIICGVGIFLCLLIIAGYSIYMKRNGGSTRDTTLIFWLEFLMLVLFGFSWIVKGKFWFFADKDEDLPPEGDPERKRYMDQPVRKEDLNEDEVLREYRIFFGLIGCENQNLPKEG